MKVEIIQERSFTLRAGEKAVHGLFHAGEWEGLTKYEAANGDSVITDGKELLRASPSILALLSANSIPAGFVLVPQVTLPGGIVVPSFFVAQFAASKGDDGKVVIDGERKPWVNINFADSKKACADAGYGMITELQWLAIAWDVSQQAANWTGGDVGVGELYQGVRHGRSALAGNETTGREDERRWLILSNGSRVCDFNGNVFQWVFDNVQGDAEGLIAKRITLDSPSMAVAPYPSQTKGMGWRPDGERDWSGSALIRGGYWSSGGNAGVFRLDLGWRDYARDGVGFRCTKPSSGL